jgi:hypothetical protein
MSWDLLLTKSSTGGADASKPTALGPLPEVIARIQQSIPEVDFTDPCWGMLEHDDVSIEFNMGSEEICAGIMLHVRGGGAPAIPITKLMKDLDLSAYDPQEDRELTLEEVREALGE